MVTRKRKQSFFFFFFFFFFLMSRSIAKKYFTNVPRFPRKKRVGDSERVFHKKAIDLWLLLNTAMFFPLNVLHATENCSRRDSILF